MLRFSGKFGSDIITPYAEAVSAAHVQEAERTQSVAERGDTRASISDAHSAASVSSALIPYIPRIRS